MANFCPNCGNEVNPGDSYCPNCGAELVPAGTAQQSAAYYDSATGTQPSSGMSTGEAAAAGALGTLVAVTLVGGATRNLYYRNGMYFMDPYCRTPFRGGRIMSHRILGGPRPAPRPAARPVAARPAARPVAARPAARPASRPRGGMGGGPRGGMGGGPRGGGPRGGRR